MTLLLCSFLWRLHWLRQSATNAQPEMPKKVRWNPDAAAWGQAAWRRNEQQETQPSADAAAANSAAAANAAANGRDGNGTTFNANELGLHAMEASPCPSPSSAADLLPEHGADSPFMCQASLSIGMMALVIESRVVLPCHGPLVGAGEAVDAGSTPTDNNAGVPGFIVHWDDGLGYPDHIVDNNGNGTATQTTSGSSNGSSSNSSSGINHNAKKLTGEKKEEEQVTKEEMDAISDKDFEEAKKTEKEKLHAIMD